MYLYSVMLKTGILSKVYSALQFTFTVPVVITLFSVSLVSLGVLDNNFRMSIPPPITMLRDHINEFSVTNSYGLFRRLVKFRKNEARSTALQLREHNYAKISPK